MLEDETGDHDRRRTRPVVSHARGEDRVLLLRVCIGEARGGAGEDLLIGEASAQGPGSSDVRSVPLDALGQRAGGTVTDVFVRALADRTVQAQISAARCVAAYGDATATAPFPSWMEKKLNRKNRLRSWDPREIPAPGLHAIKNGAVDRQGSADVYRAGRRRTLAPGGGSVEKTVEASTSGKEVTSRAWNASFLSNTPVSRSSHIVPSPPR